MNKKLNYALIVGSLCTLAGCVTGRPPSKPILACTNQALLGASVAQAHATFREDAPERYVVKRGDTLWGIAGTFLQSPYQWKNIWHSNPHIKNPNLIYPGDIISYVTVNGQRKLHIAGSTSSARAQYMKRKTSDGRPIYRLSPTVRVKELAEPIPTVPKDIVYPFISKNRIMNAKVFEKKPYILTPGGEEVSRASLLFNRPHVTEPQSQTTLSLSRHNTLFAKGESFSHEYYDVYRKGDDIYSPVHDMAITQGIRKPLGSEGIYIGQIKLIKEPNADGIATFTKVNTINPIMPNDILIPSKPSQIGEELFFMPQLPMSGSIATIIKPLNNSTDPDLRLPVPGKNINMPFTGRDMSHSKPWEAFTTGLDPYNGVNYVTSGRRDSEFAPSASQFSTLLINSGQNQGVEEGMVYQAVRAGSTKAQDRNGNDITLPTQSVGTVMIYKTYDNLSYGLVLDATKALYPGDCLISP